MRGRCVSPRRRWLACELLWLVAAVLLSLSAIVPVRGQWNATVLMPFFAPFGVCIDNTGALWVADPANRRVVHVSPVGQLLGTLTTSHPALDVVCGVALNNANTVLYLADQSNNRVIAMDTVSGALLFTFQGATFDGPYQPAVDEYDNVYVSDNNRVWMFNSSGALQRSYTSPTSAIDFYIMEGMAVSTSGQTLFVSDTGSNIVLVLNATDGSVQSVLQADSISLRSPSALAYSDQLNTLYVADTTNNRVVQFNLDTQTSVTWTPSFSNPRGIALDFSGNVYVVDTENDRVSKYSSNAAYVTSFYGDNGLELGQNGADGVAVDGAGNLYISDTFNDKSARNTLRPLHGTGDTVPCD